MAWITKKDSLPEAVVKHESIPQPQTEEVATTTIAEPEDEPEEKEDNEADEEEETEEEFTRVIVHDVLTITEDNKWLLRDMIYYNCEDVETSGDEISFTVVRDDQPDIKHIFGGHKFHMMTTDT